MTRDELIEAGMSRVLPAYSRSIGPAETQLIRDDVAAVIDTVDPLIRADEHRAITSARFLREVRAAVAEEIAQAIEADVLNESGRTDEAFAFCEGLERAAAIARQWVTSLYPSGRLANE